MPHKEKILELETEVNALLEKVEALDVEIHALKQLQRAMAVAERKKKEADIDYSKVPVVSPALLQKRKSFNKRFKLLAKDKVKQTITLQSTMNRIAGKLNEIRRTGTLADEEQFLDKIMPDIDSLSADVWKSMKDLTWKIWGDEI